MGNRCHSIKAISFFLNVEPPSRANFFGRWAIHPASSQTNPAASPTRLRGVWSKEIKSFSARLTTHWNRVLFFLRSAYLMGPTCREEAMVAMLILLSSKSCWMSSVPPRMNTSFDSLCGRIINSVAFHESSTWGDEKINKDLKQIALTAWGDENLWEYR